MDITNCLPSPPQVLRLAISLLNASVLGPRCSVTEANPSPTDFDVHINEDTGFFPPQPLPRLPSAFETWEKALEEATRSLVLGDNDWDANKTRTGERWRTAIASVRTTSSRACDHRLTGSIVARYKHGCSPVRPSSPAASAYGSCMAREFLCSFHATFDYHRFDHSSSSASCSISGSFPRAEDGSCSDFCRHGALELGAREPQASNFHRQHALRKPLLRHRGRTQFLRHLCPGRVSRRRDASHNK